MKIVTILLSCAIMCAPSSAHADANFPSRPLTLVVTVAAGGGMDGAARALSKKLSAILAQPIVIENKPGAGENIGINMVAKATADGYTLLFCSNAITINPTLCSVITPSYNVGNTFDEDLAVFVDKFVDRRSSQQCTSGDYCVGGRS